METSEVSYTYLSLEWEHSNVYEGSRSLTYGFSFEVADPIHIFGGWQNAKLDIGIPIPGGMDIVEADREGYLVGLGVKQGVGKGKTIQLRAGYIASKTEIPEIPILGYPPTIAEGDGYYLEAGIRTLPLPKWELDAFVAYFDIGDDVNSQSEMIFVTLERRIAESLGLNISGRFVFGDNESENIIFGTRYHFDF